MATMATPNSYVLIGCMLGLVTIPTCFADYIYFASPGGAEGANRPGMYGGPIRTEDNGAASNLYASGYHCAVLPAPDTFNDIEIRSISYDPVSKNLLMHVNSQFTLLKSPVCRAKPSNCVDETTFISPLFIKRQFSDIKPVAYFDSTVYFLRYTSEKVNMKEKDATLQLRKFTGCESVYPVTGNKAFDLDVCSELVVTVREERYIAAPTFKTTDHLIVIRDGRQLRFFTLLKHFTYHGKSLQSYKFQLVTIYGGKVEVLDEQDVHTSFNMFSLSQLGGISYKDGNLCWSTISRIICAQWRGDNIVNRKVLVDDVAATGVCRGSTEKLTWNVSTGVAIASVRPDLVVYFGCVMELSRKGGMGMIIANENDSKQVKNVTNDGNQVFAGSMFITSECKTDKPKPSNGSRPTISGGTNPKDGQGNNININIKQPEPAGASYASSASCLLGLLTYAHMLMATIFVKLL